MHERTPDSNRELEALAAFVHGALAALHVLGCVYNVSRRQWFDALMHAGFVVYDGRSTYLHARDAR